MTMKDKHKPLAQAVSQASPVLWPLEHPCLLLFTQTTLIHPSGLSLWQSGYMWEKKKNKYLQSVSSRHEGVPITMVCFLAGAELQFTFTQVHCRASCFWRKKWWGWTTILSGWHGLSHTHDWLARVSLKEVKWDLDTGRRELRRHQVKNCYSHTQLPLFSHPKFRMASITPQWPGY